MSIGVTTRLVDLSVEERNNVCDRCTHPYVWHARTNVGIVAWCPQNVFFPKPKPDADGWWLVGDNDPAEDTPVYFANPPHRLQRERGERGDVWLGYWPPCSQPMYWQERDDEPVGPVA